jgi:uncharacterized protein YhfF
VCVIETLAIQIVPFSELDADFAATEGEGDGSLDYWQRAHTAYFWPRLPKVKQLSSGHRGGGLSLEQV